MQLWRYFGRIRYLVIVAVLSTAAVGGAMYFGVNYAVDRAVTVDARQKATGWASYFINTMPDLDGLLRTGILNREQLRVAATAENLGDVFRFKLFDSRGGVVLVSDATTYRSEGPAAREHSETAAAVLRTGVSNIALKDGSTQANRPPLYVEAYVPILDADGVAKGVVEIYIDQTGMNALFETTFTTMAIGLAIAVALAFGVPTIGFLLSRRQANEAKRRVEFLARHDTMTGLLNRASFTEQVGNKLADQQLRGRTLAMVFFDVDEFKAINDTHGHEAGDEFLKHMARAMSVCCKPQDLVARLGGDELTIALTGRDEAEVVRVVKRIIKAVAEPLAIRGKTIFGRVSAGVFFVDDTAASVADAMHKADIALYQAKLDGGNTYRIFSTVMETRMHERRALEQRIREAAAQKAFELHYQPLLHASTKICAGFEALLRLPDGHGGYIPPAVFIPVAEAMGLISDIGNWVIEHATETAATWPADLFVSVNLSVKQFNDKTLVDNVTGALQRSGLSPERLELEVTESTLMANTESIAEQLNALKALGVSIAMDDFGTGYSSLGYLWQFGFDKIKIDRSFVNALEQQDQQAREILDTIIVLGHKLEMTVTAEGIETQSQADILADLACDHFQGYLYGRPAPASEIAPFLLANLRHRTAALPDSAAEAMLA